jgi:hypothetical protein
VLIRGGGLDTRPLLLRLTRSSPKRQESRVTVVLVVQFFFWRRARDLHPNWAEIGFELWGAVDFSARRHHGV